MWDLRPFINTFHVNIFWSPHSSILYHLEVFRGPWRAPSLRFVPRIQMNAGVWTSLTHLFSNYLRGDCQRCGLNLRRSWPPAKRPYYCRGYLAGGGTKSQTAKGFKWRVGVSGGHTSHWMKSFSVSQTDAGAFNLNDRRLFFFQAAFKKSGGFFVVVFLQDCLKLNACNNNIHTHNMYVSIMLMSLISTESGNTFVNTCCKIFLSRQLWGSPTLPVNINDY